MRSSDRVVPLGDRSVGVMLTSDHRGASFVRASGPEPIGALIQGARGRRGMSQYALADLLVALSRNESLTRGEVARWERGRRIPGPYWRRWLGVALDLAPDQLTAAMRAARSTRRSRAHSSTAGIRPYR